MATTSMMAERVTPETARKVAFTFLNNNGAKSDQLTDLSKASGFPNLYIFTTEESFVIIAADDCVKPILGYSLSGTFVAEDIPSNVNGWLKGYNDEIQNAIDSKIKATAETTKLWKDLANGDSKAAKATVIVSPLIQTKWNQNKYYNNLCPAVSDGPEGRANTGCVATAMAQIMNYWKYPTRGVGSHSYTWHDQTLSADFGATTYDWDNMANYYNYYFNNDGSIIWLSAPSSEQLSAIATLMYHCGVSVEMNYGGSSTGGSGAYTANVAEALKTYFNYCSNTIFRTKDDYENTVWINMVKHELDNSRPLEYYGQDTVPNGGGHAFVCDGYNSDSYFHFNWGWSGHYDGYFTLSNLDTGANSGESGAGNGVYTAQQGAVFGIQPVQCAASDPTNLTYSLSGLQEVTLSWNSANGAVSYNIYRNNYLVGSSSNASYTEIAPFGDNVYYVRSVDANGIMSFSSNTVTVTVEYQAPKVDDLRASYSGNTVSFTWSTPEWCYPETPSSTLTYGTQSNSGAYYSFGNNLMYWGHRHLAENLSIHQGQRLYNIDFYAFNIGEHELCIYEGTTTNTTNNKVYTVPLDLVYSQPITVTTSGWVTIDLAQPYYINNNQDLWIFIHNTETFDDLQSYLCSAEGDYGVYYSSNPLSHTYNNAPGYAFLIKAFLTDGAYTYNLYQDGVSVATNLCDTTYSNVSLNNNATNLFTVRTNYCGSETDDSNIVGFTKGVASLTTLEMATNDQMTVTEGSKLTVSGSLINNNPDHLILEDGAQLINDSENVQATVEKSITGHEATDFSGWKFIASPIAENYAPSETNGLLTNVYDLYYYDEPNHLWRNHKSGENPNFNLSNGQGYLYANDGGTSIRFAGTVLNSSLGTEVESAELSYSESAGDYAGWHLVGNPFACNATINVPCYNAIDNTTHRLSTTAHAANAYSIKPCEAVMVKVTSNGSKVTFKSGEPASNSQLNQLQITLAQNVVNRDGASSGSTTIDNAIISFNESDLLEKFLFDTDATKLYIPQNGKDFAIVTSEGQGEVPVNFRAAEDGSFTLTINPEGVEMNYLHLIDNLTGNDVDLLASPDYTFEAKTTDYASRFRLVFASVCEDADDDNENFAFINNGNIIVYKEGALQIIDITGHIVFSGDATNRISTSRMTSGVYVLRLITTNGVKTQKIIID